MSTEQDFGKFLIRKQTQTLLSLNTERQIQLRRSSQKQICLKQLCMKNQPQKRKSESLIPLTQRHIQQPTFTDIRQFQSQRSIVYKGFRYNSPSTHDEKKLLSLPQFNVKKELSQMRSSQTRFLVASHKHSVSLNNSPEIKKIVQNFMKTKFKSHQNQEQKQVFQTDREKMLYHLNNIENSLMNDIILQPFFQKKFSQKLSEAHLNIMAIAFNKSAKFGMEELRKFHENMGIKSFHFDRFKYIFLSELLKMDVGEASLFKCAETIETYRASILNKANIIKQFHGEKGVYQLSKKMYSKIFSDYNLSIYFSKISKELQVLKFSRLFQQIIHGLDSPHFSLNYLRDSHAGYNLTYVHFATFKLFLADAMYDSMPSEKNVWNILSMMDAYKSAIINKDSIKDLVEKYGYQRFIDKYIFRLKQDSDCAKLIKKMTLPHFKKHTLNMFYHFLNRQTIAFTLHDMKSLHNKCFMVSEEDQIFSKFQDTAMEMISELQPYHILLEDHYEDWLEIKPYLTRQKLPFQIVGSHEKCQKLIYEVSTEVIQKPKLLKLLEDNDVVPEVLMRRLINLLLSGRKVFKLSDIESIHKRLNITDEIYDEFEESVHKAITFTDLDLIWFYETVQSYRKYIVK